MVRVQVPESKAVNGERGLSFDDATLDEMKDRRPGLSYMLHSPPRAYVLATFALLAFMLLLWNQNLWSRGRSWNLEPLEAQDTISDIAWHQLKNARITPNRFRMLSCLNASLRGAGTTVEVGTQAGFFSNSLIKMFAPSRHVMIDIDTKASLASAMPKEQCRVHQAAQWRADCGSFASLQRYNEGGRIVWFEGRSTSGLASLPAASASFIYIDADHVGESPALELELAATKVAPGGVIGMNDYIYYDHHAKVVYTVKRALHAFLKAHQDWEVILLGLHQRDFNDIVIQRKSAPQRRCPVEDEA